MSAAVIYPPPPVGFFATERGRIALTLGAALLLHVVVILQLAFDLNEADDAPPVPSTIEVTMVHQSSEEAPEEPDYYAQANQVGGGTTTESVRATSPTPAPFPSPEAQLVAMPPPTAGGELRMTPAQYLTVDSPDEAKARDISPSELQQAQRDDGDVSRASDDPQTLNTEQQAAQTAAVAGLAAEYGPTFASTSRRRKHEYISANTKAYYAAAYMDAWRRKIERLGNLNYPVESRRDGIYGSLLLEVAVVADGSIDTIRIVRSSGYPVLDTAAMRIVRMAAPFSPFPAAIRERVDVLHITRTWEFRRGDRLTSR